MSSSVQKHLFLNTLTTLSNTPKNMNRLFETTLSIHFEYVSENGIAGSYDNSILKLMTYIIFHSRYIILNL